MIEYLYIPIILILYLKTWNYHYLIDDPVERDGYLYKGPQRVPPDWYEQKRPLLCTFTNIITFMAVCGYIHLIWGWKAALLYSVFPLNVCGVAWGRTGNYYMTTCLLCLSVLFVTMQIPKLPYYFSVLEIMF